MKNKRVFVALAAAAVTATGATAYFWNKANPVRTASSIDIIGGADGPTAIFVAGNSSPAIIAGAAMVLVGAVACVAAFVTKKLRKRNQS